MRSNRYNHRNEVLVSPYGGKNSSSKCGADLEVRRIGYLHNPQGKCRLTATNWKAEALLLRSLRQITQAASIVNIAYGIARILEYEYPKENAQQKSMLVRLDIPLGPGSSFLYVEGSSCTTPSQTGGKPVSCTREGFSFTLFYIEMVSFYFFGNTFVVWRWSGCFQK